MKTLVENEHGAVSTQSMRGCNSKISRCMVTAKLWFEKYVETTADRMPDEKKMHLPSCVTKLQVFKTYLEAFKGRKTLSETQFCRMWRQFYPYVIIPKVHWREHHTILCLILCFFMLFILLFTTF